MSGEGKAVAILRELVAMATPSAVSNLPLLDWVEAWLQSRGWTADLQRYTDENGVAKGNLIARPRGADAGPIELAFVCHTDTVPFAADWRGALALEERDGFLHGCGACDVKGSLACFLAAVATAGAEVWPGVGLILTADEEIGCKGMERLLAWERFRGIRIAAAIVSEPTSLRAGAAGKGYGLARMTVEGREAHSAFPQQGVSAISIAARMIAAIEEEFGCRQELNDHLFDPPQTTVNIGVVEGGTAKNIVPGRCCFLVEWRAIPGEAEGAVAGRLAELVATAAKQEPRAVIRCEVLRDEPGFAPAASGALRKRLAELVGSEAVGISFGSEASRMARVADEVIVMGPGDMRTAHSDRECVPVAELDRWTAVLRTILTAPGRR